MKEPVRPIHLPGAAALESVREHAAAALDEWAREWVVDDASSMSLRCSGVSVEAQSPDYQLLRAKEGCIWFRRSGTDRERLGHAIVGAARLPDVTRADSWLVAAIDQACNERDRGLCSVLLGSPIAERISPLSTLPDEVLAFGSGAVQLSCEWLGLYAVVESSVWRKIPPIARDGQRRMPRADTLDTALRGAGTRLEVMLGSVEVELFKVLDLRHGDVLRLPQRVDQPIAVLCEGRPLARGALGDSGGRKCVQLLSD